MPQLDQLSALLDRLANFDPGPFPVVSLYLDLRPNERGRETFGPFLRKELGERLRTFAAHGPQHESLEKDVQRIREYVARLDSSLNGLALFACSGAELFEAVPLAAPLTEHRLYVSDRPHLYPLARTISEFPRYAIVLADTRSARIEVWAGNAPEHVENIEGTKTRHHKMGGWSQARYQRHTENFHLHHAKEVVDALARIVRDESVGSILMAGDDVILPLLKEHVPEDLMERIVDVKLDVHAPERKVLDAAVAALRAKETETDRERVDALIDAFRANGLACVGVEATRRALDMGQVDELVIAETPETREAADELVAKAAQTSAKIRVIKDASLLERVGGVGAWLRFKL